MMDMESLPGEILDRIKTMHLLEELLHNVVERTYNHREGYFILRKWNDLARAAYQTPSPDSIVMSMGPEDVLQHMDNLIATMQRDIDYLELKS